jgi:hypothetical protein
MKIEPEMKAQNLTFESHGIRYRVNEENVISQIDCEPYKYDERYSATYDKPEYRIQSDLLQALRLGFMIGSHGKLPSTILDWGYGNGAFMKFASKKIPNVYGYDITGVEVEGCTLVNNPYVEVDVISFWDVLEHIHDLSFVQRLRCETVVISLPFCHFFTKGKKWFDEEYRHRKPNEHVHHFNENSLTSTMEKYGWSLKAKSTHEDIVRKSTDGEQNILTMSFSRKN